MSCGKPVSNSPAAARGSPVNCIWYLSVTGVTAVTGKTCASQYQICRHRRHSRHGSRLSRHNALCAVFSSQQRRVPSSETSRKQAALRPMSAPQPEAQLRRRRIPPSGGASRAPVRRCRSAHSGTLTRMAHRISAEMLTAQALSKCAFKGGTSPPLSIPLLSEGVKNETKG